MTTPNEGGRKARLKETTTEDSLVYNAVEKVTLGHPVVELAKEDCRKEILETIQVVHPEFEPERVKAALDAIIKRKEEGD